MAPLALVAASCTHDFDQFDTTGDDATTPPPGDAGVDHDAAPPSDAASSCGDAGAIAFGGHCYFAASAPGSWDASRTACVAAGAHLLTITSAGEQTAAAQVSPGVDRWIGLERAADAGATDASSFGWITGETTSYSNWSSGEPNGSGPCVRMKSDGTWGDQVCADSLAAICEVD